MEDHLSQRPTWRPRSRRVDGHPGRRFGLASGGACPAPPVARRAVRSYRTFSPLPFRAVCSLWRYPSTGGLAPASRPMAGRVSGAALNRHPAL